MSDYKICPECEGGGCFELDGNDTCDGSGIVKQVTDVEAIVKEELEEAVGTERAVWWMNEHRDIMRTNFIPSKIVDEVFKRVNNGND